MILTPCIGVCTMNPQGLCDGCLRTLEEIAGWSQMDDSRRERLMDEILPARAEASGTPQRQ